MPKGLAFLSKKSFHTAKLCNQEKVWLAEKQKEAEDAKIRELSRQIQQEREEEELQRISGNRTKRLDKGIDWMYQGGQTSGSAGGAMTAFEEEQKKKEAEEYLLGKEYNPSNLKSGDFAEAATGTSSGMNKIIASSAEILPVETQTQVKNISAEQEWNTNFHLRYEDPMFMVEERRKEKEREKEKKKQLFEEANDNYYVNRGRERGKEKRDGDRYHHKRSRKDTARHDSRRKRSHSSGRSEDSRRYRQKRDRKKDSRRAYHSRSNSRSRSRSSYRNRSHRRKRSRSRSYDDYRRSWRPDHEDQRTRESYHRSYRDQKEDPSSPSERHEKQDDSHRGKSKRYGLIGASLSKPSDIGPDISLIAKKRKEKEEARSRYFRHNRSDAMKKHKMTDEERTIALAEMQQDANERISVVSNGAASKSNKSDLYDEEIQRRMQGKTFKTHRNFLEDATAKAYAIDGSQGTSLSSRLATTRHRHQRDDGV
jgi:hypothetical protein